MQWAVSCLRFWLLSGGVGEAGPTLGSRLDFHTMSTAPCSSSCPSTGGIADSFSICSVGQSGDGGACVFMIRAVRAATAIKQHIILVIRLLFLTCLLFLSLSYHPVVLCFCSFFPVSVVWCWIQDYQPNPLSLKAILMSDRWIFTNYVVRVYFTPQKDDMLRKQNVQIDRVWIKRCFHRWRFAWQTIRNPASSLWDSSSSSFAPLIHYFFSDSLSSLSASLSVMKTFHLRRLACPDFLNCILSLWKNFAHLLSVSYVVSQFLPPPPQYHSSPLSLPLFSIPDFDEFASPKPRSSLLAFLKKHQQWTGGGGGGILRLWRAWSKSGSLSLNPASYFARLNLLTAWVNRFVLDLWTELRCGLFTPLHGLAVPACFQIGDPWLFPRRCWHSF